MFTAVNGVDLQIERGEIFGLLGPNGAGKSTTIRMLCTLLEPTSGTAQVNGFDIVKQANDVRRSLGTVLAGERSIYWKLTGRENLEYFAALYHIPPAIAKKRVEELIERMEIKDRANELVEKYSTGMRQRIAIAKALLARPPILLLDEPTLGLDPQAARRVRELIAELKQEGHTILLTTHYMEEADQLSDRIGIIDTGKVIALDTPEGLKRRIDQKEVIRLELTGWHDEIAGKLKSIAGIENIYHSPTRRSGFMGSEPACAKQPRRPASHCGTHQRQWHTFGQHEHRQAIAGRCVHPSDGQGIARLGVRIWKLLSLRLRVPWDSLGWLLICAPSGRSSAANGASLRAIQAGSLPCSSGR